MPFQPITCSLRRGAAEPANGAVSRVRSSSARITWIRALETLALDEALTDLASRHPRQADVAELRLFAGLEVKEVAFVLGVSERTVKGDWRLARAWLMRRLRPGSDE